MTLIFILVSDFFNIPIRVMMIISISRCIFYSYSSYLKFSFTNCKPFLFQHMNGMTYFVVIRDQITKSPWELTNKLSYYNCGRNLDCWNRIGASIPQEMCGDVHLEETNKLLNSICV